MKTPLTEAVCLPDDLAAPLVAMKPEMYDDVVPRAVDEAEFAAMTHAMKVLLATALREAQRSTKLVDTVYRLRSAHDLLVDARRELSVADRDLSGVLTRAESRQLTALAAAECQELSV